MFPLNKMFFFFYICNWSTELKKHAINFEFHLNNCVQSTDSWIHVGGILIANKHLFDKNGS